MLISRSHNGRFHAGNFYNRSLAAICFSDNNPLIGKKSRKAMKRVNIFLLVIFLLVMAACSLGTEPSIDSTPQPGVDVALYFSDENGDDLLNPAHAEGWNEENIDIFYLIDGEKERVYHSNLDLPKRFKIVHGTEDRYYMLLWLSEHVEDEHTVTYVEFPNGETDTLKIHAEEKSNGVVRADKFWYNEELLFEKEEIEYASLGHYEFTKSVN